MGWLWSSSSSSSSSSSGESHKPQDTGIPPTSPDTSSVALTDEQRIRIFGRPGPATSSPQTRDQQADSELDAFIKSFQEENTRSQRTDSTVPSTPLSQDTVAEQPPSIPSRLLPDGTLDISPEAIYPRTMSCRQQFDQAFYCQSLGGKFNDIYRYGHLKSCSEQWGAFWFCMRTRTLPEKEKEERIKEFYRTRDERRKEEMGSSEDVWEIRKVGIQRAFDRDPDEGETMVKE